MTLTFHPRISTARSVNIGGIIGQILQYAIRAEQQRRFLDEQRQQRHGTWTGNITPTPSSAPAGFL
jgi:hypothetical protein